ncbi:6TM ABC transporter family protein [Maioricimonas rarisocia]|nr:hypothetical protein [Maioricimonas rarisocia]
MSEDDWNEANRSTSSEFSSEQVKHDIDAAIEQYGEQGIVHDEIRPLVLLLEGKPGSGKTTMAFMLRDLEAQILSIDRFSQKIATNLVGDASDAIDAKLQLLAGRYCNSRQIGRFLKQVSQSERLAERFVAHLTDEARVKLRGQSELNVIEGYLPGQLKKCVLQALVKAGFHVWSAVRHCEDTE